jgi:hypothetical protein
MIEERFKQQAENFETYFAHLGIKVLELTTSQFIILYDGRKWRPVKSADVFMRASLSGTPMFVVHAETNVVYNTITFVPYDFY